MDKTKLSKEIKKFESEIKDLDFQVGKLQTFINNSTEKRTEYQAELDRFITLVGNEDLAIKDTLAELETVYKEQLVLQGKLDTVKDFFDEVK